MKTHMTLGTYAALIVPAILFAFGCAEVTPKENFENSMNCDIGRHISQLSPGDSFGTLTRTLDNGNSEYTRDYSNSWGSCILVREVDAKTNRIVAWRTEGDDRGCQLVP